METALVKMDSHEVLQVSSFYYHITNLFWNMVQPPHIVGNMQGWKCKNLFSPPPSFLRLWIFCCLIKALWHVQSIASIGPHLIRRYGDLFILISWKRREKERERESHSLCLSLWKQLEWRGKRCKSGRSNSPFLVLWRRRWSLAHNNIPHANARLILM